MRTQKHTFLGIDITRRKSLYAEIDALTEQVDSLVEGTRNASRTLSEATTRHENETAELKDKLAEYEAGYNALVDKCNDQSKRCRAAEEKYNAAVKYQQNTQAAYDELKAEYDQLKEKYDTCITCNTAIATERESKFAEADAVNSNAAPKACETAKDVKNTRKNGRFVKKKRDDDPRK